MRGAALWGVFYTGMGGMGGVVLGSLVVQPPSPQAPVIGTGLGVMLGMGITLALVIVRSSPKAIYRRN